MTECDSLSCGSVFSTTAEDHNMANHHIAEQDSGDSITMQEELKAHHPNKSSGLGHGCPPNGQHPSENETIANDCQYDDLVRL